MLSEEHKRKIAESIKRCHAEGRLPKVQKCPKCSSFVGKNHDCEKTREKQRQAKLKNPTRYWLGKKRDKETIKRLREGHKNYEFPKGREHWNFTESSDWCHKEARRVMAKKICRELKSEEIVHHIDGNWKNNFVENLVITTRSKHAEIHREEIISGQRKWRHSDGSIS